MGGEEPVLERIEEALKRAVVEDPDLDWEYGSKIKKQKYTDTAVDHFTIEAEIPPITRSWFKYGRATPAAPSGSNRVGSVDLSDAASSHPIYSADIDEFIHFFKYVLDNPKLNARNWFAKDLIFLQRYYRHRAPEWLRPIYQENIELRLLFWNVKTDIQSLIGSHEGGATSLAMFGGSSQSVDYYEQAGRIAATLQLELAKHDVFKPALSLVTDYTDLVEDTLMKLAGTEEENLTQDHLAAVKDLERFYDEYTWEFVAFIMSMVTVEGPNSNELREVSKRNLDRLEREYPTKLGILRATCADASLLPAAMEYPDHDDEIQETINEIVTSADARPE